jgi:hypothetical protein
MIGFHYFSPAELVGAVALCTLCSIGHPTGLSNYPVIRRSAILRNLTTSSNVVGNAFKSIRVHMRTETDYARIRIRERRLQPRPNWWGLQLMLASMGSIIAFGD